MPRTPEYVYIYATNRPDFPYAVGVIYATGPVNGSFALAGNAADALTIANAMVAAHQGCELHEPRASIRAEADAQEGTEGVTA